MAECMNSCLVHVYGDMAFLGVLKPRTQISLQLHACRFVFSETKHFLEQLQPNGSWEMPSSNAGQAPRDVSSLVARVPGLSLRRTP